MEPSSSSRPLEWTDQESSTLIDAWGARHLALARGHLRHHDWLAVAHAVNSVNSRRPPRLHSQCKNRMDTLKRRYKSERSSFGHASTWPFYHRLRQLIGGSVPPPPPSPAPSPPSLSPSIPHRKQISYTRNYSAAAAAAAAAGDSESSGSMSRERSPPRNAKGVKRPRESMSMERSPRKGVKGMRELAMAIDRFAEVYERVEREKQRQMMELERQRIEFARGMEYKRMQMFVDAQVKFEKAKRSRRADAGEKGFSAAMSLLCLPAAFDL